MTTVTQTVKRSTEDVEIDLDSIGSARSICGDPLAARRFVKRLLESANGISPLVEWTPEDLRDVIELAIREEEKPIPGVLEGRYLRKMLREQCAFAERYGDAFVCVVITLPPERNEDEYSSVLDAVLDTLRKSDLAFTYRRRIALILPRMRGEALENFLSRLDAVVDAGDNRRLVTSVETFASSDMVELDTQHVLDWAEDRLREI